MKVLELKPTKKKATVIMLEKEYDEPWWVLEPAVKPANPLLERLKRPSIAFIELVKKIVEENKVDFATEELGLRGEKEFYEGNVLARFFKKKGIPFYPVDMDEAARLYLAAGLENRRAMRNMILDELAKLPEDDWRREYLLAYGQYLQQELEKQEQEITYNVRESWIAMGIMDHINKLEKDEVTVLHISSPRHMKGLSELLSSLNVNVVPVRAEKKVEGLPEAVKGRDEVYAAIRAGRIQVIPVVQKKKGPEPPYILFFLDTDEQVSPFDICMAYDAGFDIVVPYEKVTPQTARSLVQDAIFSRGPKGAKRTNFFIGGGNLELVKKIVKEVVGAMFPPFEATVIVDPRGANTTAAAMVLKVVKGARKIGLHPLEGKKAVILGGTGRVGGSVAVLLARMGCDVTIVETYPPADMEWVKARGKELSEEAGAEIKAVKATTQDEIYEVVKDAQLILATGVAGVQLMAEETVKKLSGKKILADVNAVPPPGIAGVKPKHDMKEISPGVYGIGALAIGDLKYKIERHILVEAKKAKKGVYDLEKIFSEAKKMLEAPKVEEVKIPKVIEVAASS